MKIGNWWKYENDNVTLLLKVDSLTEINGVKYVAISESKKNKSNSASGSNLSYYYRYSGNGIIKKLIQDCKPLPHPQLSDRGLCALAGTDWIWYNFGQLKPCHYFSYSNALDGENFVHFYDVELLSTNRTIVINKIIYKRCYVYKFRAYGVSDNDRFEWFAPGIGMIRRGGEDTRFHYFLVDYHLED